LTLDLADYSLQDVVHTVVTAVGSLASGKKLALTADVASNLPAGPGGERRPAQVLLNLVRHGIKFTRARSRRPRKTAPSRSPCAIPDRAFPFRIRARFSRNFSRRTIPQPSGKAEPALVYRSPSASSGCTADASGSSPMSAKVQLSRLRFR